MGDIMDKEDKLEERIASRRHKELLDAVRGIKLQPRDDAETKSLLNKVLNSHDVFLKKIEELQKQELPKNEINIPQTDNTELIKTFRSIADEVIKSNEKLCYKIDEMIIESKRQKSFDLKVNRNKHSDTIDSINGKIE